MRNGAAINLDANASYGVLPEVYEGVRESFGTLNPSSIHAGGQRARALIEAARDSVAALLGLSRSERVIFTSGATEANSTALFSPFLSEERGAPDRCYWLTSALEHHSVLEPCVRLSASGFSGRILSAERGFLTGEDLRSAVTADTRIVTAMFANNETGHLSPLSELVKATKERNENCRFHVDAVQLLGKSDFRLFDLLIDSASFSAHKIGGLPGVGALVIRTDLPYNPLLVGGAQEIRHRAGTENVAGIVSFGIAAEVVRKGLAERFRKLDADRRFLEERLRTGVEGISFNHPVEGGLINTVSVTVPGVRADDLVVALDLRGVYVSSGAACASGKPEPSHVLKALGLSDESARSTVRLSLRADHTAEELAQAVDAFTAAVSGGRCR
ncbi:MAG: hypothetical protein RL417_778 [Pseudomonadota bacterium]